MKLISVIFPFVARHKGGAEFKKHLMSAGHLVQFLKSDESGTLKTPLDKFGYTNREVLEITGVAKIKKNPDGTSPLEDTDENSLKRVQNGKRVTLSQPEHFQNRIYFAGSCHFFGINASFDKTIESFLQQMLNENNLPYRVENEGQHYRGRHQDFFYNLHTLNPAPNDIIFVWIQSPFSTKLPRLNLTNVFDPPHDYREIFCSKGHVNELGYKILAKRFFDVLTKNNFYRDKEFDYPLPPPPPHRYGIPPQYEPIGEKLSAAKW